MGRLSGKIALVTGAAGGIGHATAELFAKEGAIVIAADKALITKPFQYGVTQRQMDVTQEAAWADIVQKIEADHGQLDVLVNNAGVPGSMAPIESETLDAWNQALSINLTSVFLGMRAAVPLMLRAGKGSIVNTSSIWGITAVAAGASYHASKAGVRLLTKQAAITYAARGIRVNSVHPGIVETPMTAGQDASNAFTVAATPMKRMGQPGELAAGFLFLASDESSFMTGAELVIDGGYTAQ